MGYDDYKASSSRNTIIYAVIVIAIISVPVFFYFWSPYEIDLTTTTDTTTDTTTTTPPEIHNPYEVFEDSSGYEKLFFVGENWFDKE